MTLPVEKGVSPPPRLDAAALAEMATIGGKGLRQLAQYLTALDIWFRNIRDAYPRVRVYSVSVDLANTPANSTAVTTVTVTGLSTTDIVLVNKPTHTSGLGIVNARVSAADTLEITTMNTTGAGINPGAETYLVVAVRQ